MTEKEIVHEGTVLPTCPWCGYSHHNYFEFHEGNKYICDECGREFEVTTTETSVSFWTKKRGA